MKFPVFKDFFKEKKKIFFKHRIMISLLCKIYLVSDYATPFLSKLIFQELYVFVTLGTKKLLENVKIFLLLSFLSSILKHQIVAIF